jgi:ectoine hydroxylase-related dioxygenase (phytanoyl-CoA dioxygenase family)
MEFAKFQVYPQDKIDEHVFNMETRGYHLFEGFFDDKDCDYLKSKLQHAIDTYVPFDNSERSLLDKYHMHDLLCKDVAFGKMLEDPRLNQIIASILGDYWIMYAHTSSSLPPHGNNYGSRIHVDSPRMIPNYPTNLGVIWTLDEFTEDNGGTYVLPGSHHTKLVPTNEIFEKNSERILCKRGSLIIFNARVWHRAGENKTNEFRHSLTMNICRPYMKQRMDWVRFIPASMTDQLNAQARRIIGFDTRLPASLEEFFQPEEKRLYKGGQE